MNNADTASSASAVNVDIEEPQIPIAKNGSEKEVVDLCDVNVEIDLVSGVVEDDDDDIEVSAVIAAPPSRKRKLGNSPMSSGAEAIDLCTGKAEEDESTESFAYRKVLGPLRMGFVESFSANHSFDAKSRQKNVSRVQTANLYRELVEYQINLPVTATGSVFCRALESRVNLVRAMITGPEGTPYANGCFFFDIFLHDYPNSPPEVKFLTTNQGKVRFNPNLYECGKVCLSLLGTWSGPGWIPNQSTLLQVLVSIQGLILVADPYFNEPGFEQSRGSVNGTNQSNAYSLGVRQNTVEHAIVEPLRFLVNTNSKQPGSAFASLQAALGGGQKRKKTAAKKYSALLYADFDLAMREHFVQRAGAIKQDLKEWQKLDQTSRFKGMCNEAVYLLDQLEAQSIQMQQEADERKAAAKDRQSEVVQID